MKFLLLMMLVISHSESPTLSKEHLTDLKEMAPIYYSVGRQGKLVGPSVDPMILASVSFYESRYFGRHTPDGDCHIRQYDKKKICMSVGPMQLYKGVDWAVRMEAKRANHQNKKLHTVTMAQLKKDPLLNVQSAYLMMQRMKRVCKTPTIGALISSYGSGKCLKRSGWEGDRRCALAEAMAEKAGVKGKWRCGIRKPVRPHTLYLIRRLKKSKLKK